MNLAKNLEMSAFYFPERPAISEDHKETSYTLLNELANQVATALLKTGIASGDVGVLDDNDYLFIVDRLKDMIISGGENVYSTEVEEVLYAFPAIQECAVIGTPDKEWGERVIAFILPKPGQTIDQKELTDFLKARLSAYKVPKRFFMVDDFPRSPAGKLLKRKLRESFLKDDDSA